MDSSSGQPSASEQAHGRTAASERTRGRLMKAAAELIAEVGWGRVTTRAVAERADLPHGAVSYHFRGKRELLTEAALRAFEEAVPIAAFESMRSVDEMIGLIAAEVGEIEPLLSRLMMESMREAERDPALRARLGEMLAAYRARMTELVRTDQERGAGFAGAPPDGVATLLAAAGDGLVLHALLDPELDTGAAIEALRAMTRPR